MGSKRNNHSKKNPFSIQSSHLITYPWSGRNNFFIKASYDALAIGAGGGHYGLWLDPDLNGGRTQKCDTFENLPLTAGPGDGGDFEIFQLEAWGFALL